MRRQHCHPLSIAWPPSAFVAALCTAMVLVCPSSSWGQEKSSRRNSTSEEQAQAKQWAEQAARLALAEAQAYDLRVGERDGERLKLSEQPVLKWSNTYEASV